MTLADKLVVMNGGRVEQIGTPLEVYAEAGHTCSSPASSARRR
jgi:sn-glycerol 3-phosphate transport system ATP-binding protein